MAQSEKLDSYVVVLRASSAARFTDDGWLSILNQRTNYGSVNLVFRTRYDDSSLDAKIPRELWIDARGPAPSIDSAIEAFAGAASFFLPMLSVTTNAAILDLQVHLAFNNTRGLKEREFFQAFIPEERGLPRVTRKVNAKMSEEFFACVSKCGEHERLLRACEQYRQALTHWGNGQELLALAHLYMGVEALTKSLLRRLCKQHQTDEDGLASLFSVEKSELDATIRREVIFQGDLDCHREAKKASDGFEHGFLGFGDLRAIAARRRDQTAEYLRKAILDVAQCDDALRKKLLENTVAVGAWRLERYFRGLLVGEGDELAAPDQAYPIVRWRSSIARAHATPTGEITVEHNEEFTPRLAEGISLKPGSVEMWGPKTGGAETIRTGQMTTRVRTARKPDAKRNAIVQFLERVNSVVLEYGTGCLFEFSPVEAVILSIYAGCRSQFHAVTLLLTNGLPNEAMAVVAVMQRHAFKLQYLAETEERLPLVLGWVAETPKLNRQMKETMATEGPESGLLESLNISELEVENLEAYAAAHSVPILRFPGDEELFHRSSTLMRLGCQLGKHIALGHGRSYDTGVSENTIGFDSACHDVSYLGLVGAIAVESILLASRSAGVIFGWPDPDGYESLEETVHSLM